MNWLDIILIILNIVIIIGGLVAIIWAVKDAYDLIGIVLSILGILIVEIGLLSLTFFIPFVVIDKYSGSTIGTITSVDKNFFGTIAVYVKTSETEQEIYCIEDSELANEAQNLIGKKVKVSYGERVGFYSTGKCHEAPLDTIEISEVSDENN